MKTIALALAAVIAAGLASTPASAQDSAPDSVRQVRISYSGLDLGTPQGRAALDLRIARAARSTCGTPSSADLRGGRKFDACVAEFRAQADRQLAVALARRAEPAFALSR